MPRSTGQLRARLSKVKFTVEVVVVHTDNDEADDIAKAASEGLWLDVENTMGDDAFKIRTIKSLKGLPGGYTGDCEPWPCNMQPNGLTIDDILSGKDPFEISCCSECGQEIENED